MGVRFGHGGAMVAWGRGCGWVLILRGVVITETMPVEAWRLASNRF